MALKSRICEILGIEYPILLAGMGGASVPALAAAVSNAGGLGALGAAACSPRSEEHTSELQSLMGISYDGFCLKKKKTETREKSTKKQKTINQSNINKNIFTI